MQTRSGKVRLLIVRHGETDCNVQGIIQGQLDTELNGVGRRQAEHAGAELSKHHIDEVYASPLRRAKDTADTIVAVHPHHGSSQMAYWTDDRLKERAFGTLEGKTFDRSKPKRDSIQGIEQMDVFIDRLSGFLTDVLTRPAPFSPSEAKIHSDASRHWAEVTRRVTIDHSGDGDGDVKKDSNALLIGKNSFERTILLVAHGAAISALVGSFLQDMGLATLAKGLVRTRIWNCSITEVIVDMAQLPTRDSRVDLEPLIRDQSDKGFIIERWADVSHLPDDIDDAVNGLGNVDEMVGKVASS
ncbi:hypothetical protein CBS101457_000715 [Exobasidium rhododendri]|nr:hypothetical protein CBS101457_000715 [Exobasidium rhododendri]